jgi:hypothetical protein
LPEEWRESIGVTIFNEGDKTDCSKCNGMSVLSTTYKLLSNILLSHLLPYAKKIIGDRKCGYRRNRSTTDHTFVKHLRKNREQSEAVHQLFQNSRKQIIQLGQGSCVTFLLSWYPYETNNVKVKVKQSHYRPKCPRGFQEVKVKQSRYRPKWPRGFQEIKVPRLHDNGTGWWQGCQP